jgi:hypothetical protein
VPAGWLKEQYPELREDCEILERRMRAAVQMYRGVPKVEAMKQG